MSLSVEALRAVGGPPSWGHAGSPRAVTASRAAIVAEGTDLPDARAVRDGGVAR